MLSPKFSDSRTIKSENLINKSDLEIWQYAKKFEYIIVSQDNDFNDLLNLYGAPPKVIWIRIGNTTTAAVAKILENIYDDLLEFSKNPNFSCFEVHYAL